MNRKIQLLALGVLGAALVMVLMLAATKVEARPLAQATATPAATVSATAVMSPTMGMMDTAAQEKYCTDKGGAVSVRTPYYNTNANEALWLELGNPRAFCTFLETAADATGFRSQISIALDTLTTDKPTLAVLAYLEPQALPAFTGANPSSLYCSQLGGTDLWGGANSVAGGGWVSSQAASDTNFQVVNMCLFADGSAIDSWGLTYKAGGVMRGTDLAQVVAYQPTELPHVFSGGTNPNAPAEGAVDKMLTNSDNKSNVTLTVGDTLKVQLTSNPSTGYAWKVVGNDGKVLSAAGEPQFSLGGKTPLPGAGGTETFTFNAVAKGTTALTLNYVRPWETTVTPTPDDVWMVNVTVE